MVGWARHRRLLGFRLKLSNWAMGVQSQLPTRIAPCSAGAVLVMLTGGPTLRSRCRELQPQNVITVTLEPA